MNEFCSVKQEVRHDHPKGLGMCRIGRRLRIHVDWEGENGTENRQRAGLWHIIVKDPFLMHFQCKWIGTKSTFCAVNTRLQQAKLDTSSGSYSLLSIKLYLFPKTVFPVVTQSKNFVLNSVTWFICLRQLKPHISADKMMMIGDFFPPYSINFAHFSYPLCIKSWILPLSISRQWRLYCLSCSVI